MFTKNKIKELLPKINVPYYCFKINNKKEATFLEKIFNFNCFNVGIKKHTVSEIFINSKSLKQTGYRHKPTNYTQEEIVSDDICYVLNTKDIILKYKLLTLKNDRF